MKKIAYINFFKYAAPNIEKKLFSMAMGARRAGITNIDFLNINSVSNNVSGQVKHIRFPYNNSPLKYYYFFVSRYQLIERSLNLKNYDYIILRYCNGDPSGGSFFSKYNIISEHHTKEVYEYQSRLQSDLPLYDKISSRFRLELEQTYGPKMLRQARGIIGVTNEITEYELDRINKKIPSINITNGITVQQIAKIGYKKFDGKNFDMAFVVSSFAPWHGIERVVRSIGKYKGCVNIRLHIVGNIDKQNIIKNINGQHEVIFHGYKSDKEFDSILKNSNIGISTLGLFHKGMNEACSLKTREYTARGLPFIMAYHDPDLQYVDNNRQFFLKFPNNNSRIDFQEVIEFAENISKKDDLSEYMRDYAEMYMDWSVKMKQYVNFVQEVDQLNGLLPDRKVV